MPKTSDAARKAVAERAHFEDSHTLCWTRLFHVPIQRVWEAVTSAEQLNLWFMPVWSVDARLGGKCSFGFGGHGEADAWEITVFEPPRVVEYSFISPPKSPALGPDQLPYRFRFELEQVDAAIRFTFKECTPELVDGHPNCVPGTAWQPGPSAGFHSTLDRAERFFADNLSAEQIVHASARLVANAPYTKDEELSYASPAGWFDQLMGAYYEFIAEHCPRP